MRVFVALGSNLGDPARNVREGMARLQQFSTAPLLKSSLWRSAPVGCPPGSPDFVNAVVGLLLRPEETPESLLVALQKLEKDSGRGLRKVRNEPRCLDLDLIVFGAEVRSTPGLILPHPRAHQRRFVLQPLAELAPDLVLPGQARTAAQLLAALPPDDSVRRLE
jgi:2-amino-4-hydroxy-6-hydroxymethyldihydropteridine diphosphokinase